MVRRELAKDPKLATESWDRFLPQFRKRHLTSAQKSAKKREKQGGTDANATPLGADPSSTTEAGTSAPPEKKEKEKPKKKIYTPFPPAQLPRKVDLQLESGEYFLKAKDKEAREEAKRKARQAEATAERKKEREEVYVAPAEEREATVQEKAKRKKRKEEQANEGADDEELARKERKRLKREGKAKREAEGMELH